MRHQRNAATRVGVPQFATYDATFDAASGVRTQRTTVVVWPCHAISLGTGWFSALHHHYATQVNISLGAPFRVRMSTSEPYIEQQSLIVGPNIPHEVEMTGVPCFMLWSEARALADLARRQRATSTSELPALPEGILQALVPILLASVGQVPDEEAGQALLAHIVSMLIGPNSADEGVEDPRIATARSLVTQQFLLEQSQPITSLATSVHLSPSRFRHLFRSEVGMSVQSYLRWRRLYTALRTTSYGVSLTEAAYTAGFADSAHLTRVCRATFGIPPARIFKNSHAVQVIPGSGC